MTSLAALLDDIEESNSKNSNQRTYHFENEIQKMMFACGDSAKPSLDSAHLIEQIVHQQLTSLLLQAQDVADMRESNFIKTEDILFLMRKDKMKLRRAVKFLCFTDTRYSLQSATTEFADNIEKKLSMGGKRRQLCKDFLMNMDSTGQLLEWVENDGVHDEVKEDRMLRADLKANSMDAEEYLAFAQARGQSFTQNSNSNSIKLRGWLFSDKDYIGDPSGAQLPQGHGIHMEILGYVAHETLAQIIDFALLVRRDANALTTDPINRLMPPSLFTPRAMMSPRQLHYQQYATSNHPSAPLISFGQPNEVKSKCLKIEGTPPLTPNEIREAVRRYWTPISIFNVFSRNMHAPKDRQLFCK